jgi:hypothetical protein
MSDAKLKLIAESKHREVWIFVHGYKAICSREEYEELVRNILCPKQVRGRVYLFYWKSGDWKTQGKLTMAHAGTWIYRAWKAKQLISFMSPQTIALEVLGHTAIELGMFCIKKMYAENYGYSLLNRVSKLKDIKNYKINLVGHSLGARLIQYSLEASNWNSYNLKNIFFLGSAGDLEDDDYWEECLANTGAKIHNFYSESDYVLTAAMSNLNFKVGRNRIEGFYRIKNYKTTLGHTEYWSNWHQLVRRIK